MNGTIGFSWQVLYRSDAPLFGRFGPSPILKFEEPASFFNRISARDRTLYHAVDLTFTNLFHTQLHRAMQTRVGEIKGKNFPYEFQLNSFGRRCRIGFSAQIFLPDLISIRVICHDRISLEEQTAFRLRQFRDHPDLVFASDELVRIISQAVFGGVVFENLQNRPIIHLHYDSEDNDVIFADEALSVALLINDRHYRDSNTKIRESIIESNREHNLKGEKSKRILINKQGYLYITNANAVSSALAMQEVRKRERMYELGCVLQRFYERYPEFRQSFMREMDYLFFATLGYVKGASLTFEASFGNTLAWEVISESLMLDTALERSSRFDVGSASRLSNLFDRIPRPKYSNNGFWETVREILGEDYMKNKNTSASFNIETNYGPIATGDNSNAIVGFLNASDRTEILRLIEQMAQLRGHVAEGQLRDDYDEAIVVLKKEVKSENPDSGRLKKSMGVLKSIGEGVAGNAAAATIIAGISKIFGF